MATKARVADRVLLLRPGCARIDSGARKVTQPEVSSSGAIGVRPVASLDELIQLQNVISAQFPPRRSPRSRGDNAFADQFNANRRLMLVAEIEGDIVGGALGLRIGDAVKLDVIAVVPEFRRMGIGRKLMNAIEAEAMSLGARSIFLGGANEENRRFYSRLGYQGRNSLMQKGLRIATLRPGI